MFKKVVTVLGFFACIFFTLKAQFKELVRECDDLRSSRDEATNCSKETEKKLKNMEADVLRFQEVLRVVNRHRAVWLVTFCSVFLRPVAAACVKSGFHCQYAPCRTWPLQTD